MSLLRKRQSWYENFSRKQWIIGLVLAVSLLGNVVTVVGLTLINQRPYDYWVANYSLQRMCARDLKQNLLDLSSESNRAFYSVSNCSGWNYKTGALMGGDIKAMMDKVEATQAPAGTVIAPPVAEFDFAGLFKPYHP
ncbi:MAG TPA: hypothetical protein VI322_02275 [Candidatus Saccharimonadia bacterium]